jgi:hypothetical protein
VVVFCVSALINTTTFFIFQAIIIIYFNSLSLKLARMPALPVFSFAKWHIFTATARYSEAEQLLDLYPEHVLMSYLRVKSNLKDQPELLKQLNLIFENNSNFVEIKI